MIKTGAMNGASLSMNSSAMIKRDSQVNKPMELGKYDRRYSDCTVSQIVIELPL